MSKDLAARPESALGRFWRKWRFHLNILLILILSMVGKSYLVKEYIWHLLEITD